MASGARRTALKTEAEKFLAAINAFVDAHNDGGPRFSSSG